MLLVFESRTQRRRSDIINYNFPRNCPSTHTHVLPVTPRTSVVVDDDDRLSVNAHRDTATITSGPYREPDSVSFSSHYSRHSLNTRVVDTEPYLPDLVMIISVPSSLNLSHRSLFSR